MLAVALILGLLTPPALAAEARTYDITVSPVHEVCLEGSGDAAWATALLAPEGLAPHLEEGRARLSLCGTSSRFGGRNFQEAIFTVEVEAPEGGEATFLVEALESLRLYARVERRRNRSPYAWGAVRERFDEQGAALGFGPPESPWFEAHTTFAAPPSPPEPQVFEGAIHQPGHTLFYARLEGDRAEAPCSPADTLTLGPVGVSALSDALRASGFTPERWLLRAAGTHAKTNTLDRAPLVAPAATP